MKFFLWHLQTISCLLKIEKKTWHINIKIQTILLFVLRRWVIGAIHKWRQYPRGVVKNWVKTVIKEGVKNSDFFVTSFMDGPRQASMTQLLTHTVAHSTRPSFRPKTNNQPTKKFLSLVVSWVKVVKMCKILTFKVNFLCRKGSESF